MISKDNLYQPDKYPVLLGEGKSVGFCTVWNDAEKSAKECPELLKRSAIVGTLYSRQGVNIILRNLALNPQVRKLYVWSHGALSCSPFGVTGKEVLEKIWENGVKETGEVPGLNFKIEKEIDPSVVNKITRSVEMIKLGDINIKEATKTIREDGIKPYMEPIRFADAVPETVETFPSEELGWVTRGSFIADVWLRVLDRIMRYGTIKGTQYGQRQRELIGVTWVITEEDPLRPHLQKDWPDDLKKIVGFTENAIKEYHNVFLSPRLPAGIEYTYGNRLMNYPAQGASVDQVKEVIIKNLKDSPDSRRAVATTMVPPIDRSSKEPPCITQVQAIQSRGRLNFLVTVRSHDIFKAAIPNAFGLRMLQKTITDELGFKIGALQITSQSAHVYESDWDEARKLIQCEIWNREPSLMFDPATESDPRGIVLVSVKNGKILCEFKGGNGEELLTLEGKTALELGRKIAHLDLLSRADHLLYIGTQIQNAEIALKYNLPFTQDRPLNINVNGKAEINSSKASEARKGGDVCGSDVCE